METAIINLNKTIELREEMIYFILKSKHLSDSQYDKLEHKLLNSPFLTIKKQYEKIK